RRGRRRAGGPPLVVVARRLARPQIHGGTAGRTVADDVDTLARRYPGDRPVGVQVPLLNGRATAGPDDQLRTVGGGAAAGLQALAGPGVDQRPARDRRVGTGDERDARRGRQPGGRRRDSKTKSDLHEVPALRRLPELRSSSIPDATVNTPYG